MAFRPAPRPWRQIRAAGSASRGPLARSAAGSLTAHAVVLGGLAVWAGQVLVFGGVAARPVPSVAVSAAVAPQVEILPQPAAAAVAPQPVEPVLVPTPLEPEAVEPDLEWVSPLARALPRAAFRRHQVEKRLAERQLAEESVPALAALAPSPAIEPPPALVAEPQPAPEPVAAVTEPQVSRDTCPGPDYPRSARRRGLEGVVRLRVSTDAAGDVTAVTLAETSGYDVLDRAARAAVRTWRLAPARRGGLAVPGSTTVDVRFSLRAPRP